MSPDFHNRLVALYLERLKRHNDGKEAIEGGFESDDDLSRWREKLLLFLKTSRQYSLARALGLIPRDGDFPTVPVIHNG
jgi:Vam6/Vps39-like protein vacuolar protein sorting-associated protein 39